jgi:hypothetical protein
MPLENVIFSMEALFMDEIAKRLGPAFAAGFAVQRLLEILDALFGGLGTLGNYKKFAFNIVSLGMGLWIAYAAKLQVIHAFTGAQASKGLDMFFTGLVISGGTEGFNSIMKFLSYKKEEKKIDAVTKSPDRPEERKTLRAVASRI